MKWTRCFLLAVAAAAACVPASAETDLAGSWGSRNTEDNQDRFNGPASVDYSGLPLNESGRAKALSYSQSQISMPERVCLFYPPYYEMVGPFGLRIWSEVQPDTGAVLAWVVGGWEDKAPQTIWMDGRAHPSKNAAHTKAGFTTGKWEGDVLTTFTTHIKAGYIRRNGSPSSDQATVSTHYIRHGDLLTVTAMLDDPAYFAEPMYWTRTFQMESNPVAGGGPPCIQGDEGIAEGAVPHYLPGKNPFMDELPTKLHIPMDAALGGPETMYPEFRKKMKDTYVQPEPCKKGCGPGMGPGGAP